MADSSGTWLALSTTVSTTIWLIPLFLLLLKEILEEAIECTQGRRQERQGRREEERQEERRQPRRTQSIGRYLQQRNQSTTMPNMNTPTSSEGQAAMAITTQRIVMPAPRTVGAPYFNGNNVTEFLETIEYLFEDAIIIDRRQRVMRIARYYKDSISGYVKGLDYYRDGE